MQNFEQNSYRYKKKYSTEINLKMKLTWSYVIYPLDLLKPNT